MKIQMLNHRVHHIRVISAYFILLISVPCVFGKTPHSLSQSKRLEIRYDHFNDISELQLNGNAAQAEGLNGNQCLRITPSDYDQAGSFFSKSRIPLIDSTGFNASFQAFFSFRMTDSKTKTGNDPDGPGADGIVFVVQTVSNNVGAIGGGIGYMGIPRSVGIEFDSWYNPENSDQDGNHIGINTVGSARSLETLKITERFNSGKIYYAWIDYDGVSDILEIRFSDEKKYPSSPVMTYKIDLTAVLEEENVFVGFTSGTGYACNNHDILEFRFVNNSRINDLIGPQYFTIRESATEGFNVGTVKLNNSAKSKITLTHTGLSKEFSFNTENQVITVAENTKFNYDSNKNVYSFNVEALYVDTIAESLISTRRDTALITIRILKDNLIDPQTFSLKETEKEGFEIGVVKVNSPEPDKIKLLPLPVQREFKFENSNKKIFVASNTRFNNSDQNSYTFNMQAMFIDSLTPSLADTLFDTALITIYILKNNLIDPQSFIIKETEKEGFKVGIVEVHSPEPDNIKLSPVSIPAEFTFKNSNKTISVAAAAHFSYADQKEYTFNMQAMFIDVLSPTFIDTVFDTALITIKIHQGIINITDAVYSDENGDGSIDRVIISVDIKPDSLPEKLYLINPFNSNDSASIKKDDITWDDKILKIDLPEPFQFSGSTFFQTDAYGIFDDPFYNKSPFDIKDGVAPVIIEADFYPAEKSDNNTLIVKFSEIISKDIEYSKPFTFINGSNDTYTMTLKQISKTDNTHTFDVIEISNNIRPSYNSNDSIWIDTEAKIADVSMNHQEVKDNRKVKLNVHRGQFQFVVKPLVPFAIGKTDIPDIDNVKPNFSTGTVITVDFFEDIIDLISDYSIKIFDAVGNTLADSKNNSNNIEKMVVTEKNQTKIYFFWNGYNYNNRPVGIGAYYGMVNAEVDNTKLSKEFYLFVTSD